MPTGGFLRTNFRRTGGSSMLAIGGGVLAGSWGGAVGPNYAQNFGFICGSFMGQAASNAAVNIALCSDLDPYVAMTSYYGTIYTSGYRIYPFVINVISIGTASVSIPAGAATATPNYYVPLVSYSNSVSTSAPMIMLAASNAVVASTWSARFVWAGFVVSTP